MSTDQNWPDHCCTHAAHDPECYACYEAAKGPEVLAAEANAEMAAENAWLVYAERPDSEDEIYRNI